MQKSVFFKKKLNILIITIVGLSVLYCGDPIPVQEMGTARYEINRAESVNAAKYAPEKLEAAKTALFEAHDFVGDKKIKEAREKAIEARDLAIEAFNTSAPLLAKDTKTEAEEIMAQAERAYAEEFAAVEYEAAISYLASGDEKFQAEDYYNSFLDYEQAREEAVKARDKAEAHAEELGREVQAARDQLKEAIQYKADTSSPDKINTAEDELDKADEAISNMMLKDAYESLQIAKENIDQALSIAKKNWATNKRIEASAAVEEAESQMVAFKERLDNSAKKQEFLNNEEAQTNYKSTQEALLSAQEFLSASGDALEASEYDDSYSQSEEAIRLSSIVREQIPLLLVMLATGKSANDQVVNIDPTDNDPTDPTDDDPTGKGIEKDWKTYTVRLIPRNRDCLWKISEYSFIYGNPYLWSRIYKANKHKIRNPDLIFPGQVFDIPPKDGSLSELIRKRKEQKENPEKKTESGTTNEEEKTTEDDAAYEDDSYEDSNDANTTTP
ncbi:MAG: hypothetical protein ABUK01_05605 [Leptospirales bacterium]